MLVAQTPDLCLRIAIDSVKGTVSGMARRMYKQVRPTTTLAAYVISMFHDYITRAYAQNLYLRVR